MPTVGHVPQEELDRWARDGLIRPEDARPVDTPEPAPKQVLQKVKQKENPKVATVKLPDVPASQSVRFSVTLALPVTVLSEMNWRGHWAVRRRRFDKQSQALLDALVELGWYSDVTGYLWPFGFPVTVIFTRFHYRGQDMDDDNLRSAFKAVRDAVAEWAGIDDKDKRFTFEYRDQPGKPGIAVTIEGTK